MFCIRALLVLLLTVKTVNGRELIVPAGTIREGALFHIYCDASRVDLLHKYASILYQLKVSWKPPGEQDNKYQVLSKYHVLLYILKDPAEQNTSPGRNWLHEFRGRLSIKNQKKLQKNDWDFVKAYNNINTMKLKISVWEGKLADAGTYQCCVTYRLPGPSIKMTDVCSTQVVTAHVKSRQPIIPVGLITEEVPFTIHCDGSRVNLPENTKYINRMKLDRKPKGASDKLYENLAEYGVWDPVKVFQFERIPEGRNWTITFEGMHNRLDHSDDMIVPDVLWSKVRNVNTSKITILVEDSKLEDAGTYRCTVEFYTATEYSWFPPSSTETVDAIRCSDDHYGQNCTMICSEGCNDGKCDRVDGSCAGSCKDGFYGETCSSTCPDRCLDGKCDQETAKCDIYNLELDVTDV